VSLTGAQGKKFYLVAHLKGGEGEKSHYFCTDHNTQTQKQLKADVPSRYVVNEVKSKTFCCNFETKCKKF